MEFTLVSSSTFHSAGTQQLGPTQETLLSYLDMILYGDFSEYSEEELYMMVSMVSMNYKERVKFIATYIKSKVTGTSADELFIVSLSDENIIASQNGIDVSWDEIVLKSNLLNIDISMIESMISQSNKNIIVGTTDDVIISKTSELLTRGILPSRIPIISDVHDGALISQYTTEASDMLSNLVKQLGAGNDWSIDYILYLIYEQSELALAKLNMANQISLNSLNAYKYSLIGTDGSLSSSSVFGHLAISNKASNLLLDEVYSASDAKVPNRLDISALLSDLIHSASTMVFSFNLNKNQNELGDGMDSTLLYNDQLNRSLLLSGGSINNSSLDSIDSLLRSTPNSYMVSSMGANVGGSHKLSNKIPNSEANLVAILGSLGAFSLLLNGKMSKLIEEFFGVGGDSVDKLTSLIDNLTGKLSTLVGPMLARVVNILATLALVVVAVKAILCAFKGLMCAIGSLNASLNDAMGVAKGLKDKFNSYTNNVNLNKSALSDLSGSFTNFSVKDVGNILQDGLLSIGDEIIAQLSTLVSPEQLQTIKNSLAGDCGVCTLANKAYDSVKGHIDDFVTSAYDSVANSITEGMKCPALKMPDLSGFSSPKLPQGFDMNLPSLSLKVGC